MASPILPRVYLFDNGSLRPESTLNLREVARGLRSALGQPVEPVSLLHSSGVSADQLGGKPARLLEPTLIEHLSVEPESELTLLPLFFGPSGALTEYLPARLSRLRTRFPDAKIRVAEPLCPDNEMAPADVVEALADAAMAVIKGWEKPWVILVDHGSPQPGVARVRDALAGALQGRLDAQVAGVLPASMERKPGDGYAFNEPLLATRLRQAPTHEGRVAVVLQFFSPGRHAGQGGDIAQICAEAQAERSDLRIRISDTIGTSPHICRLLARRWREAQA